MTLGTRLKELRRQKGLTQTEVGERIGVSLNTMSKIESNKCDIPGESLKKASELFNVSADYLLFGIETERTISESEQEVIEIMRRDMDFSEAVKQAASLKKKVINYLTNYQPHQAHAA